VKDPIPEVCGTGQRVRLVRLTDPDLIAQLGQRADVLRVSDSDAALVFFQIDATTDLDALDGLRSAIRPDGAIWIAHPKGRADLKDTPRIAAGRAAGLWLMKLKRIWLTTRCSHSGGSGAPDSVLSPRPVPGPTGRMAKPKFSASANDHARELIASAARTEPLRGFAGSRRMRAERDHQPGGVR